MLSILLVMPVFSQVSVNILSPTNYQEIDIATFLLVEVEATSSAGAITAVNLYYNGIPWLPAMTLSATPSIYTKGWGAWPDGTYELTAVATDDQGNVATSAPVVLYVGPTAGNNRIINGEFTVDQHWWTFNAYTSGSGTASGALVFDPALGLTAHAPGVTVNITESFVNWDVQVFQKMVVEAGKDYEISFTASVTEAKPITISVNYNYGTFSAMWSQAITLDPAVTSYGPYTFPSAVTDSNLVFKFVLGGNTVAVNLDAVKFIDTSMPDAHLPVELTSFTAVGGDGRVNLHWVTESEINNDAFILERSLDGEEFEVLDEIAGHGSTSERHVYNYIDENVFNGMVYHYRLSDRDYNGVITTHTVVSAVPNSVGIIAESGIDKVIESFDFAPAYPNPFNPETTLRFAVPNTSGKVRNVRLNVYNMLGQHVATLYNGPLGGGEFRMKWDGLNDNGQSQPSGMYVLRFSSDDYVDVQRIVLLR